MTARGREQLGDVESDLGLPSGDGCGTKSGNRVEGKGVRVDDDETVSRREGLGERNDSRDSGLTYELSGTTRWEKKGETQRQRVSERWRVVEESGGRTETQHHYVLEVGRHVC